MLKSGEVRRQVAQRIRELLPKAKGWQESADTKIGGQIADLLAKFQLAGQEHTLVVEVSSLGQPRQIRAAVTRLNEIRRELPGAHPVAAAIYIGPQSARILKSNNLGFVDLSGNCYLAFENVLIEKEGKRNVRPSTRPLRSLFAPRATRVVRVLLVEPSRAWRLEEIGRAAEVSLGHSHNVIKRLEELAWVERDDSQRFRLSKPADLLEAWCESYTYRANERASYLAPERVTRKFMGEIARVAGAEGRRYAFTLNAGAALLAPSLRLPAVHCYLEGDPAPAAYALRLPRAAQKDGQLCFDGPHHLGVVYSDFAKPGSKLCFVHQLHALLARSRRLGPLGT